MTTLSLRIKLTDGAFWFLKWVCQQSILKMAYSVTVMLNNKQPGCKKSVGLKQLSAIHFIKRFITTDTGVWLLIICKNMKSKFYMPLKQLIIIINYSI